MRKITIGGGVPFLLVVLVQVRTATTAVHSCFICFFMLLDFLLLTNSLRLFVIFYFCCAVYVFLYSCYFFVTQSEMDNIASLAVYFGYSFLSAIVLFVMCGAMGFTATYVFVRTVFAAIKVD